ncbi:MAG: hypothetical protein AAFY26_17435 [Cyanobacteria bacterium J06638_22]
MVDRLQKFLLFTLATAATVTVAGTAQAQEVLDAEDFPTLPEELDDTYYGPSGDYYRNTGLLGTLTWLFGPFPENNISRGAQAHMDLVEELLEIQGTADPTIRTPDLPTAFDNSLQTLPPYEPPRPTPAPAFVPPAVNPPTPAPAAAPAGPVRGLY